MLPLAVQGCALHFWSASLRATVPLICLAESKELVQSVFNFLLCIKFIRFLSEEKSENYLRTFHELLLKEPGSVPVKTAN